MNIIGVNSDVKLAKRNLKKCLYVMFWVLYAYLIVAYYIINKLYQQLFYNRLTDACHVNGIIEIINKMLDAQYTTSKV